MYFVHVKIYRKCFDLFSVKRFFYSCWLSSKLCVRIFSLQWPSTRPSNFKRRNSWNVYASCITIENWKIAWHTEWSFCLLYSRCVHSSTEWMTLPIVWTVNCEFAELKNGYFIHFAATLTTWSYNWKLKLKKYIK